MADSREEGNGENVTNQLGEEDDFLLVEDGVAASVAKEVYHVYDSDDVDTSDDKYHEARDNLRAYGETRRRREVQSKRVVDGEEVDQLDEFEDVEHESGEEQRMGMVNMERMQGERNQRLRLPIILYPTILPLFPNKSLVIIRMTRFKDCLKIQIMFV
ncbi:unnamed protein product [Linum trigynum]|uniref:Uncharacterized protein n=1 Tax=Linum trigynum TaxID=586398 RepID=A0AAV2FXF0_9ROSI